MNKIKNFLAHFKVYLDRGKVHWGNLQFLSTILILLGVYRDTAIGRFIFEYSLITIPLIVLMFLAVLILIGRFEYKTGLVDRELKINNNHNPELKAILKKLNVS